jgi:hypothetical protein
MPTKSLNNKLMTRTKREARTDISNKPKAAVN